MTTLLDHPLGLFAASLVVLGLAAWLGAFRLDRIRGQVAATQGPFAVVQGASLTLLGLIIGFAFSMAVGRYDQRKNFEEEEANAIGTEYVRADFLPAADAAKVRALLLQYLEQRMLFYTDRDAVELERVGAATARLQAQLWDAVKAPAAAQPTPVTALVVSGMNDVLNTQGYTQAAWWNRIPTAAWMLMGLIAIFATLQVSVGVREVRAASVVLMILPVVVSVAFFLIADIDSPRGGTIRVQPHNLMSLQQSLHRP